MPELPQAPCSAPTGCPLGVFPPSRNRDFISLKSRGGDAVAAVVVANRAAVRLGIGRRLHRSSWGNDGINTPC